MRNDHRHATRHRFKRWKSESLVQRRINEKTRQIVKSGLVLIRYESGQNDTFFVRRSCNRLKNLLTLPSFCPGNHQRILVEQRMSETPQRFIALDQREDIFAWFKCRQRQDELIRQMVFLLYADERFIIAAHHAKLRADTARNNRNLFLRDTILHRQIVFGRSRHGDDAISSPYQIAEIDEKMPHTLFPRKGFRKQLE